MRIRRPLHAFLTCGALIVGCGSHDAVESPVGSAPTSAALTPVREVVVEMDIPASKSLAELAVVASELQFDANAKLVTASGKYAGVAHIGSDAVRLGRDVELGTLLSVGDVAVSEGVHVHGDLRTSGVIGAPPSASYTVDGVVAQHEAIPLRKLTRRAGFGAPGSAVRVGPNAPLATTVEPGSYPSLDVGPGSQVVLRAGNYLFEDLALGSNSKLTIDDRDGDVFVYVGRKIALNGQIARALSGHPRLIVSYLGDAPIVLSRPFVGALFAPNASIVLHATSTPHQGAFYARKVQVQAGARVVHRTMPWLIEKVSFDKRVACAGDTVRIAVEAPDPADPTKRAAVAIDGAPVDAMYDQVSGGPGEKLYAITAAAADGTRESRIVRLPVVACPSDQPKRPVLLAEANLQVADTVDLTVANAPELGDATYQWSFGDGTVTSGPSPAVTHSYADAVPSGAERAAFDVTVTVKRAGKADVSATRTFVVWSSYEMSRARGLLDPPTSAVDPLLKRTTSGFAGEIEFTNRESVTLSYDRRRIDLVPCDGDEPMTFGGDESISIAVPAKGLTRQPLSIPTSSFPDRMCSVVAHFWGTTASGTNAHVNVQFDRPSRPGKGTPASDATTAMLNYLVKSGDLPAGRRVRSAQIADLYRARRIPAVATTAVALSGSAPPVPRESCDPEDPGPPPAPGFSCQPTGKWEGAEDPTLALGDRIQNAYKGDAVLVRGCGGMIAPLLGSLNPPQLFTHTGIMTKHRSEIAHSTASLDWLQGTQTNGVGGNPTDGFNESGLRYMWPGAIVTSVREAFVEGRELSTPEGDLLRVANFNRNEVRCSGDAQVVHPRVLKPYPIYEATTRTQLMAAADAAKNIGGHYRFSSYSHAPANGDPDPSGPHRLGSKLYGFTYGPVPTVCSSFVRLSLLEAGFELDRDKGFPVASDTRGGAADGLFFYDVDERNAAGNALYSGVYNDVMRQLALEGEKGDSYWFKPIELEFPPVGAFAPRGTYGTIVKWATDAPDDVASQVTNCFASDFCSEDAKDSDAWEDPGDGIAVSPDDMLNHFDSPRTGGPYGYSERMIYRGRDFRPVYEWRPVEGSLAVPVRVVTADGSPVDLAQVTIPGFLTTPVMTKTDGSVLIEGVPRGNMMIHAQKFFAEPAPGHLREAHACYTPVSLTGTTDNQLYIVACDDFSKRLSETPVTEARIVIVPPREDFRKVTISAGAKLTDCDCVGDDVANHSIYKVCNVNPIDRVAVVEMGKSSLCSDEIGVEFVAKCTLESDNRTVHVVGSFKLYEGAADTCGGSELEDAKYFDFIVSPGTLTPGGLKLQHDDYSCGYNCADTADITGFKVENIAAD